MFERFTDRARKILALANQEAARFSAKEVGTEHFILGMIKEESSVAGTVLKNFNITLREARLMVDKLYPQKNEPLGDRVPLSREANDAIKAAADVAYKCSSHNYIGSEHLLLGVLSIPNAAGVTLLAYLGAKPADVEQEVLYLLGLGELPGVPEPVESVRPFTPFLVTRTRTIQ